MSLQYCNGKVRGWNVFAPFACILLHTPFAHGEVTQTVSHAKKGVGGTHRRQKQISHREKKGTSSFLYTTQVWCLVPRFFITTWCSVKTKFQFRYKLKGDMTSREHRTIRMEERMRYKRVISGIVLRSSPNWTIFFYFCWLIGRSIEAFGQAPRR